MLKSALIISFLFLNSNSIRMSAKPQKTSGVELIELCTILDKENGFYRSIDTSISEDGKLVVLDKGNRLIHVYNLNGKLITEFGKEGNGPGELNNANKVFAFNERVLVQNRQKLMFFDYKGNLITEILERTAGASIFKTSKGFKYVFDGNRPSEFLVKEFDLEGKVLKQIKNPRFKELQKEFAAQPKTYEAALATVGVRLKKLYEAAHDLMPYKNGYIRRYNMEYKFETLDANFSVKNEVTRPFIRQAENWDPFAGFEELTSGLSDEQKKRQYNYTLERSKAQARLSKGYKNDIQEIVGLYKDYIFLSVASVNDKGIAYGSPQGAERDYILDVISPELKFYTSLRLRDLKISDIDQLNWLTIKENKMIFEMHSSEFGPYVKVFDIKIL